MEKSTGPPPLVFTRVTATWSLTKCVTNRLPCGSHALHHLKWTTLLLSCRTDKWMVVHLMDYCCCCVSMKHFKQFVDAARTRDVLNLINKTEETGRCFMDNSLCCSVFTTLGFWQGPVMLGLSRFPRASAVGGQHSALSIHTCILGISMTTCSGHWSIYTANVILLFFVSLCKTVDCFPSADSILSLGNVMYFHLVLTWNYGKSEAWLVSSLSLG